MAAVGEIGSTPGVNYLSQYFSKLPRDERWVNFKFLLLKITQYYLKLR